MEGPSAIRVLVVLLLFGALAYFALRLWRDKRGQRAAGKDIDFRPTIGFTRQDGWKSMALLLENRSADPVWTEEIEIILSDLDASEQAFEPSFRQVHKIRQHVRPSDVLPISLVEPVYNAAGQPQRKYSCVMSSVLRYRSGEKWYEEPMKTYRLYMAGLTVVDIRRERKTARNLKRQDKSQDLHPVDTNLK